MLSRQVPVYVSGNSRGDRATNAAASGQQHHNGDLVFAHLVEGAKPTEVNSRLGRIGAGSGFSEYRLIRIVDGPARGAIFHGAQHPGLELGDILAYIERALDSGHELF